MKKALLAVLLLAPPTLIAAPAAVDAASGSMLSGALIEALAAIDKPELSGVFTYVGEANAPHAFADLVARDPKAMKRYTNKLAADLRAAGGTTAWDHEVCATLVTHYSGPAIAGLVRPSAKSLKVLNDSVLSEVKELQAIVSARRR